MIMILYAKSMQVPYKGKKKALYNMKERISRDTFVGSRSIQFLNNQMKRKLIKIDISYVASRQPFKLSCIST